MIKAKCVQKFRDKNNHIYGYRLQDTNGSTKDVTNMYSMFKNCEAKSLDLSSFDTSNVKSMYDIFNRCKAKIKAKDLNILEEYKKCM